MALTRVGTNLITDSDVFAIDLHPASVGLREFNISGSHVNGSVVTVDGSGNFVFQLPMARTLNDLTDVDTTGEATGKVLAYNGTTWVPTTIAPLLNYSLSQATDVLITSLISNDYLYYNGTRWINREIRLDDLFDVVVSSPSNGQALTYNGTNWIASTLSLGEINTASNLGTGVGIFSSKLVANLQFKSLKISGNLSISSTSNDITIATTGFATVATSGVYADLTGKPFIPTDIDSLTDVDTDTVPPIVGDTLRWNGIKWTASPTAGTVNVLDDLADVIISTPISSNYLKYNGANWINSMISYNELTSRPTLATVATSGSYTDLVNKPHVPVSISDLSDVNTAGAGIGQVLKWNGTYWIPQAEAGAGAGEANTISNIGGGTEIFAQKVGIDLQLKTLIPGSNIQLTHNSNTVTITSINTTLVERVIFKYSQGASGTLNIIGALVSNTSGISVNIIDAINCIVEFTFTGAYHYPPMSITTYAQVYGTNEFQIKTVANLSNTGVAKVADTGSSASPDLVNNSVITPLIVLQLRMSDTGASAGISQRAQLMVQFAMCG